MRKDMPIGAVSCRVVPAFGWSVRCSCSRTPRGAEFRLSDRSPAIARQPDRCTAMRDVPSPAWRHVGISTYCRRMNEPRRWTVALDVRDDAPGMFVPVDLLPDALVGDSVTISSSRPATVRRGRIVEQLDDDVRGRFFSVSLE
jgi:hypothetical protein